MITQLRGLLVATRPPTLVIDVGGVGYEVDAPLSTLEMLPQCGAEVLIHTHLSVREDGQALFGFHSRGERDLFRRLIRVSGVGPKLALALLSSVDGTELVRCVHNDDPQRLTAVPGIGRKTAERLIVELRDRLDGLALGGSDLGTEQPGGPTNGAGGATDAAGEAIDGLIALGYKPAEAARMVRAVASDDATGCETLIRRALQRAVPQRG